mgnify:CR=1 FL=1
MEDSARWEADPAAVKMGNESQSVSGPWAAPNEGGEKSRQHTSVGNQEPEDGFRDSVDIQDVGQCIPQAAAFIQCPAKAIDGS